jgi:hypothetical protein
MGRGVGVMVDFGVGLVGASVGVGVGVDVRFCWEEMVTTKT